MIVAISLPREERVRLAGLLDGFGPLVLVSTIDEARKLLDRSPRVFADRVAVEPSTTAAPVKDVAGIRIDSDRLVATRSQHRVELTPLEHDLLLCLGTEPRRTWTHSAIHQSVWNTHKPGHRADIHSVVKRLRRKLAELGAPMIIEAVRGVGYRLGDPPESNGWP